jgi:large repetitive protein
VKSRKPGSSRRSRIEQEKSRKRAASARRVQLIEHLEDRRLMAVDPINGLFYPPIGKYAAVLPMGTRAEYVRLSDLQFANRVGGGESPAEGDGGFYTGTESEPNNTINNTNFLPLGTAAGKVSTVTISGTLPQQLGGVFSNDEDYFSFDLQAGDIFDAAIDGQPIIANGFWDISLGTATGSELIGSTVLVPAIYPDSSPLSDANILSGGIDNRDASLQYVIPTSGRYTFRVSGGVNAYSLVLKVYRPVLENSPIGTKQILFMDFDGANVNRNTWDPSLFGTARLSPLSDFLPNWGLQASDENAVIDAIIANVTETFIGSLRATGGNGLYRVTGNAGEFDLEIRNSRDHADPWGLPNVSRMLIGGTIAELGIPTIGIAQTIDIGNFETEETAVVLLDLLSEVATDPNSINSIPLSGSTTRIRAIGEVVGNIAVHEAGHYFGAWHTDNSNNVIQIIDSGGVAISVFAGVGLDGIFGTADDIDIDFGTDRYSPAEFFTGRQNSAANMAFGLSTGKIGGSVTGTQFNDRNRNGRRDSGEEGLAGFTVYVDFDRDGQFDAGEPSAITSSTGAFSVTAPAGTHYIRVVQPSGWSQTLPAAGFLTAVVTNNNTVSGLTFGSNQVNASATGFVWNDANGNGIRDNGEGPMAGIWVYIDLDGDDRIDLSEPSAISKTDGSYNLQFPGAGTYTIRQVLEPGYIQTYPGGAGEHTLPYDGVHPIVGQDFGVQLARDYGDLPAPYATLATANGASHGYLDGFKLGAIWDAELDGQPSTNADGDDNFGVSDANSKVIDDEDGVILLRPIVAGRTDNLVRVTTTNTTTVTGYLHGWVDFNGDGDFTDAGEKIITNRALGTGTIDITFSAPAGANLGQSYARFRYADQLDLVATGTARAGEVEDYYFRVSDRLDLAVDDTFTVARNSVGNSLDVLANDFKISGETITVVRVGTSSAGGLVQIGPNGLTVTYTPPQGFIGQDTFTYEMRNANGDRDSATVVVNVNQVFSDPIALDDSYNVAVNAISVPLSVLANDIEGTNGALSIVAVSPGSQGGSITIAPGSQALRYTPARNFAGTEQFTYTVTDAGGKTSSATVTVHMGAGDVAGLNLVVTDLSGNPISQIVQGQQFELRFFVDDLRTSSNSPNAAITAPGVFAAYLDVLYSAGLVQVVPAATPNPNGTIDFNVAFQPPYTQGKTGDGLIPGVIDDFGALAGGVVNFEDPTLFARIRFLAASPGLAEFVGDPGDNPPFTDVLMYDTPFTPVSLQDILYGRTSLEIIGNGVEFPVAVDDSFNSAIAVNATDVAIPDVMLNDSKGSTGSIRLSSVTQPANGLVRIDDNGTPANFADDRIRYTPNFSFSGTEQFSYTITDLRGFSSTARVTLQVGNSGADDEVQLNLVVTDLNGSPIDEIVAGNTFKVRGTVKDLNIRGSAEPGIYAAFQDMLYSSAFVTPVAVTVSPSKPLGFDITFGANYANEPTGDILTPGIINEVGAVQTTLTSLGDGEFLQFEIVFRANSAGLAQFVGDPADVSPIHDTLTYNPVAPVHFSKIKYGFDSILVTSGSGGGSGEGYTNSWNRYDVNNDGYVSAIDALGLINSLNNVGPRALGGDGEGEQDNWYPDVNSDGYLSAVDVLSVINELNRRNSGSAEGEGAEGEGAEILTAMLTLGTPSDDQEVVLGVSSSDTATVVVTKSVTQVGPVLAPTSAAAGLSLEDYLAASSLSDEAEGDEDWFGDLASDVAQQWLS